MAAASQISSDHSHGDSWSSLWLPIDLILEDAMDHGQATATSAVEIISGMAVWMNFGMIILPALCCWNG